MSLVEDLKHIADPIVAEHSQRFFKTGKDEYGEGDRFLGIRVPKVRAVAKKHRNLSLQELDEVLASPYHEVRLCGLLVLVHQFTSAKDLERKARIYHYYVRQFEHINNWDLVDTTCHKIVGAFLYDKDREVLYQWARSHDLWTRRISIISTFWFIKQNELDDSYQLARILMHDEHDLIHKAVGWVLRECGKKDFQRLEHFIDRHASTMPRTMLRYAIEKFPENKRLSVLKIKPGV